MEIPMIPLQKGYCINRKSLSSEAVSPDREMYELYCEQFDQEKFESAFKILCKKHPMLLARFDIDNELQIVDYNIKIPIVYRRIDCGYRNSKAERQTILKNIFNSATINGTALQEVDVLLYTDGNASIVLLTDGIGIDGISQEILIRDLDLLYQCKEIKESYEYERFIKITRNIANEEKKKIDFEYWKNTFASQVNPYTINGVSENNISRDDAVVVNRKIPKAVWKHLEELAGNNFVSLYSVIFSIYLRLLERYSNMETFMISMPVSIRNYELRNIENTVGMLTDFVPFKYIAKKETLLETICRIQEQLWNIQEHGSLSGTDILRVAQENQKEQIKLKWSFTAIMPFYDGEKKFLRKSVKLVTSSLDVETVILPDNDGMTLIMIYRPAHVSGNIINRMADHFIELFHILSNDKSNINMEEIPLYSVDKRIIESANRTEQKEYKIPLSELVRKSINKYSSRIAIITEEKYYSYNDLYIEASKIENKLLFWKSNYKEFRIGIFMEKSARQIILALASIFAGIPYMPIETTLQVDEINWCIKKSRIVLIITEEALIKKTKGFVCITKTLDEILDGTTTKYPILKKNSTKNRIAIIINTSGTTGYPKSVLLTEQGIVNCLIYSEDVFNIKGNDIRTIAVTNFCHDMAIYDYLGMFILGGSIVIPHYSKVKDPKYLAYLINEFHVTIWNSVPGIIEMLLMLRDEDLTKSLIWLKKIILGGDWVRADTVKRIWKYSPEASIYSVGGPTETTIWNISHKIAKDDIEKGYIPYGKPFPNTKYHILDKKNRKCPIGIIGTMYIEGIGVSFGYASDKEETFKQFTMFSGKQVFESGDTGIYLDNGEIRFTGRSDNQIKINGKRIELGGVERRVNEIPQISTNCCVLLNLKNSLALFYEGNISENQVRNILESKLNSYMIPSFIVKIDKIPLVVHPFRISTLTM